VITSTTENHPQDPIASSAGITAVVGGSGFYELACLENRKDLAVTTPYGEVTGIERGNIANQTVIFMMRHGLGHKVPPHKINYRANVWALKSLGVTRIVAINAVGGIAPDCAPGALVIPDQIIDYSYGREHTFASVLSDEINHIEFAEPYCAELRGSLLSAALKLKIPVVAGGCYACTQGPRLETAAEISRLKRDGNTLVGMTAMPEAALARELGIAYGAICIVANWGAGIVPEPIELKEIHKIIAEAVGKVQQLISAAI
jgi:5'-deoxy-5'-methylthioadenosine phosphorylase